MKAMGIYGGTFDPIHLGHLITAQAVKEIRDLSKIIFVPNYISPHKTDVKSSAPTDRLKMLKLAVDYNSDFEVSDFEILKEGISFTIDTLKELKKEYENIELIIGYDNLLCFESWHNPDEIIKIAKLIVLKRNVEEKSAGENKYFKHAVFVDAPVIDITATVIRDRVKENLPIDFLVPPRVNKYIIENRLYSN